MRDTLADARVFRTLNVADDFSRECLAIEVARSIPGERVTRVLDRIAEERGYPSGLVIDNGPEFAGGALDRWAFEHGVTLHFIDPGKPVQIEAWRVDYNRDRPHSSLGNLSPGEFARRALQETEKTGTGELSVRAGQ
jgi:putative transposase